MLHASVCTASPHLTKLPNLYDNFEILISAFNEQLKLYMSSKSSKFAKYSSLLAVKIPEHRVTVGDCLQLVHAL